MNDHAKMLELIGLRPIMVDNLGRDAVILPDYGLVLVDREASRGRRAEITGLILSEALALESRQDAPA